MRDHSTYSLKALVKKVPGVAAAYRYMRDYRLLRAEPRPTPFGFKIVGSKAMQDGDYEVTDTEVFRKFAAGSDVVVNAGAHIGYYCLHALALGKRVVAFEPMPANSAVLCKNVFLNGWGNRAEVFKLALGEAVGIEPMYGRGSGSSLIRGWAGFSSKLPTLVPVSTLDAVLGDRFKGQKVLVLVDVEGGEHELLLGAKKLLDADPRPIWMVEIALFEHQPKERGRNRNFLRTFELFWERGYGAYGIVGKEVRSFSRKEITADPGAVKNNLSSSNFIFIHASADAV